MAIFAMLANGAQTPVRALFGQTSKLSRTMHDIRYDAVHDEMVVPVPYAQAILTFRGGADGQEGPIRIIQGMKTGEIGSRLDVDPVHNEIFTYRDNSIEVYQRDANGDVAPLRIIQGPDTQLKNVYSLAVDPVNDVLVVGLNSNFGSERATGARAERGAILVFGRTDQGNVKPKAAIRGEKSRIVRINQMQVWPQRKEIIVAM